MKKYLAVLVLPIALAACQRGGGTVGHEPFPSHPHQQQEINHNAIIMAAGPRYVMGNPFMVDNVQHTPAENMHFNQTGMVGIIPMDLNGSQTANGEVFNSEHMLATSKTLPLPSVVRVTNLDNGQSVVVRVNNRGPFVNTRIMDISPAAARAIGMTGQTRAQVQILATESAAVRDATLRAGGAGAMDTAPVVDYGPPVTAPLDQAAGTGPFAVQIAAFYSEDSARNMANRLQHVGPVHVVEENHMFRVRISGLDAPSARRAIDTLRRNEGLAPGLLRDGRWINADSI